MKKLASLAAIFGLAAGVANAGSIQRDGDRSQILFEEGNYLQFSVTHVAPNVSGNFAGVNSGNIGQSYQSYSLSYKGQVNDRLSYAVIVNNPVGADVSYATGTGYFFAGSSALVESRGYTGLLRYAAGNGFSVYGGLRLVDLEGQVNLIGAGGALGTYTLNVGSDVQLGYVLGVAYEKPEIGLRASLTYDSKTEHDFIDNVGTPFEVEIPQAVTLNLRTGIAANTLLFGSVRWQEWSQFDVAPNDFLSNPLNVQQLPIAFGADDYFTYEIGVGRRFNKNWAGALTVGYENDSGGLVGNLEGRDGFVSYGASVRYSTETFDVTAGLKYFDLGSVNTTTINADFSGNSALAFGLQIGTRF